MKTIKYLAVTVILVAIIIIGFRWNAGLFTKVVITEKPMGPYYMVYKDYVGISRKKDEIMDNMVILLQQDDIKVKQTAEIIYGPFKIEDKNKRESRIGCIIDAADTVSLKQDASGYNLMKIDQANFIVIEFPYRNRFTKIEANRKIYPRLENYIEEKGYKIKPRVKLYDAENELIVFMMEKENS